MNNIKIIITEPTEIENTKSVGCFFIEDSIRKSGYNIKYVEFEKLKDETADIILFSIHHVKDLFYLAKLYKYKKNIWIGGGHVMNNPYPFLHFFDIICVGEGEEWIIKILDIIQEYGIENINEI
ncbi:MAG: cobalamin B12-binding domain-containing protein, partial [Bacteroidales bacterium]|nr:cobalamin B12-binding domain-containing protein [Bacteroidales bacterium]